VDFGFDGPLSSVTNIDMPASLRDFRSVQQLLATPEGQLWWYGDPARGLEPHAMGMGMNFNLRDGSHSFNVLKGYVERLVGENRMDAVTSMAYRGCRALMRFFLWIRAHPVVCVMTYSRQPCLLYGIRGDDFCAFLSLYFP
jgi:hypothetical protein